MTPTDRSRTSCIERTFAALQEAKEELEKQINLPLAAGLIHNNLQYGPF